MFRLSPSGNLNYPFVSKNINVQRSTFILEIWNVASWCLLLAKSSIFTNVVPKMVRKSHFLVFIYVSFLSYYTLRSVTMKTKTWMEMHSTSPAPSKTTNIKIINEREECCYREDKRVKLKEGGWWWRLRRRRVSFLTAFQILESGIRILRPGEVFLDLYIEQPSSGKPRTRVRFSKLVITQKDISSKMIHEVSAG